MADIQKKLRQFSSFHNRLKIQILIKTLEILYFLWAFKEEKKCPFLLDVKKIVEVGRSYKCPKLYVFWFFRYLYVFS